MVDLGAADKADVALAQQAAHFAAQLVLGDVHHGHEGYKVVEHDGQQAVLIILQPLTLRLPQRVVPAIYIDYDVNAYSMTLIFRLSASDCLGGDPGA